MNRSFVCPACHSRNLIDGACMDCGAAIDTAAGPSPSPPRSLDEARPDRQSQAFANFDPLASTGSSSGRFAQPAPHGVPGKDPGRPHPYIRVKDYNPLLLSGDQSIELRFMHLGFAGDPEDIRVDLRSNALLIHPHADDVPDFDDEDGAYVLHCRFATASVHHGVQSIEVSVRLLRDGVPYRMLHGMIKVPVLPPNWTSVDVREMFQGSGMTVEISGSAASLSGLSNLNLQRLRIDDSAALVKFEEQLRNNRPLEVEWDVRLLDRSLRRATVSTHPSPTVAASWMGAPPKAAHCVRLIALSTTVFGRWMEDEPEADVLLRIWPPGTPEADRKLAAISRRHFQIHWQGRFFLEDISSLGTKVDGICHGKGSKVLLADGAVIELTYNRPGLLHLKVRTLGSHALCIERNDPARAEEMILLVAPNSPISGPFKDWDDQLPIFFHDKDGFWTLDPASGKAAPLTRESRLAAPGHSGRFEPNPYPDATIIGYRPGAADRAPP